MQMLSRALWNLGKRTLYFTLLIFTSVCWGKSSAPTYTAPLATPTLHQVSDHIARVTVRLNPLLNPTHSYNIGIFSLGRDLMYNCESYANYDGCYFQNITTSSSIIFLMAGDFTDGLQTDKHAILIVFSIGAPESTTRSDGFEGINYPKGNAATIEYFPFKRLELD